MKALKILIILTITSFAACNKPKAEIATPKNDGAALPIDEKVRATVSWQDFKKKADDQLNVAECNINAMREKMYSSSAKDKVKIRRTINKTEYQVEKLRKELYDHDAWFDKHIENFTDQNAVKIEAFKQRFENNLAKVNAELEDCNC